MESKATWTLIEYLADDGKIIISSPGIDVDSFSQVGELLISTLSATIVEKQFDADLHSWLIDFEGCRFFFKAEHYSESIWFEAIAVESSREEFDYLAEIFRVGFKL